MSEQRVRDLLDHVKTLDQDRRISNGPIEFRNHYDHVECDTIQELRDKLDGTQAELERVNSKVEELEIKMIDACSKVEEALDRIDDFANDADDKKIAEVKRLLNEARDLL